MYVCLNVCMHCMCVFVYMLCLQWMYCSYRKSCIQFSVVFLKVRIVPSVKNVIHVLPMLFGMYDADGFPWYINIHTNLIFHIINVLYLDVMCATYAFFVVMYA